MGAVYRATDPALDRTVAIKTINPALIAGGELRDEFLERFRREAKAAGRLSHPNIVSVFDLGLDEATSTPFIVMEYVPGVSLEAVLKENPLLPLVQALEIVEQVASALEEAHRNGIVHRDVKPANIFLDERGRVKVGDFGVARLDGSDLTQSGVRVGTPGYTAPEVLQGAVADARADVFALGVLAYRLFTGTRPFSGTMPEALAIDILQREPASPRAVRPELPERLSAGVMRALAKSPAERTPSALAFLQELRAPPVAVPRTPVPSPPTMLMVDVAAAPGGMPTRTEPVQTKIRRGPRWFPTAALLAAALAVGACGYLVMRALSQQQAATTAPVPATVAPAATARRASPAASQRPESPPASVAPAAQGASSADRARKLVKDAEELWREAQNKADRDREQEKKGQDKGRGRGKKEKGRKNDHH